MPGTSSATGPQYPSRASPWLWLIPVLLLGGWLHWPGGADFKSDDYGIIRYVSNFSNCLADFVGPQYDLEFFRFWRPFITLSFGIDYMLFGTEPFGYFAMNCLALLVAACLLAALLASLWPGRRRAAFAITVVLLWLCHPASGTALRCWAAGRVDTHYVPPLLLALLLHVRHRRGRPRWPVWIAAMVAIGTKESALGFPLLALAIDLLDPRPPLRTAPRILGYPLPALPYLLLFPVCFLLRYLFLGSMIGGYDSVPEVGLVVRNAPAGIWHFFGRIWFPETPLAIRQVGSVFVLGLLAHWIWRGSGRVARFCAVVLILTALVGPIVQLIPSADTQDLRLSYFASIFVLVLWIGTCLRSNQRLPRWRVALAITPLLWLLPAYFTERTRMDGHDAYVTSLKTALHRCDGLLPEGEPVVIIDDDGIGRHIYRLFWAHGSILKPPFQSRPRDVVILWPLIGGGLRANPEVAAAGLNAWVEVTAEDCRVVTATPTTRRRDAAPVGFSGRLTVDLLDDLESVLRAGYSVGPDYLGSVTICTTMGSITIPVKADAGVVLLHKILMPVVQTIWVPADLDKDSPIFLVFSHESGVSVARLSIGPGYARKHAQRLRNR